MAEELKGKALTVLGVIDPDNLGPTLPHEHVLVDGSPFLSLLPPCEELVDLDIKMKNLGKITYSPYSVRANVILDSAMEAISELKVFKQAGGGTVCDVTITGIRNKPELLPQVSRESGVNIITGTGFYVNSFLPEYAKNLTSNEMADAMTKEILHGIGDSGVRCGVIGEIGCSYPLEDSEKRALQAAALVQTKTGAPLIVHPGRDSAAPFEIISILESHGANISRTVMSHLDRTIFDNQKLLEFARMGSLLEYDLFGVECSHYQIGSSVDMPSDAQRIQKVKVLVDNGFADRVVISQDIHTKVRLVRYGGHGYGHILENIVPKMEARGIPPDVVQQIVNKNTRKWLTFV